MKGGVELDTDIILMEEWAKEKVVKGLSGAVGDDLLESIRKADLSERFSNGKKMLKWDLINRNFIKAFRNSDIVAKYANRGPWFMVPLVDKRNGVVYSVLREDRFSELHSKRDRRKKAHYIDAFLQMFNFNITEYRQVSFFNDDFPDEEVCNIVQSVLESLNVARGIIKRHAIILFEEYNHELVNVRCCIVDTNLNIVFEESWNQYIKHEQSTITEQLAENEMKEELVKPTLGKKARARKGSKVKISSNDILQKDAN
ncbi:MAG: hypothetical protein K2K17_01040 [Lachnospiraceae bacterium]|nr:hypothetical protein [Lachnospiraceae bacterium]